MPKEKRKKLTRKQIKYFGTKRQKAALKSRSSASRGKSVKSKRSTTRKAASKKKKSTSSTRPAWVTAAIYAAVAALAIAAGLTVNKYVQQRGGWEAMYQAYQSGGWEGLLGKVMSPVTVNPTSQAAALTSSQGSKLLTTPTSGGQPFPGLVPEVKQIASNVGAWIFGPPAPTLLGIPETQGYIAYPQPPGVIRQGDIGTIDEFGIMVGPDGRPLLPY